MAINAIFVGTPAELKALTSAQRSGAGGARVLQDPAGDGSLPPAWYFAVAGSTEAESAPTYYRFDDDTGTWYQGSGTGGGGGGSPTGAAGGDLTGTYPDPTIATAAVTGPKIASDAVTASKIANNAVTTAKIADSNVTTAKLADSNVTTAKIADSNVTAAKLATNSVTTTKVADGAITAAKLAAGAGGITSVTAIADLKAISTSGLATGATVGVARPDGVVRNKAAIYAYIAEQNVTNDTGRMIVRPDSGDGYWVALDRVEVSINPPQFNLYGANLQGHIRWMQTGTFPDRVIFWDWIPSISDWVKSGPPAFGSGAPVYIGDFVGQIYQDSDTNATYLWNGGWLTL